MIFEVWFTLAVMATLACVLAFSSGHPVAYLVSGVLWFIVAFNCADIDFIIVYSNSDYLRDFQYPYLIVFFSLMGLMSLLAFLSSMFDYLRKREEGLVYR